MEAAASVIREIAEKVCLWIRRRNELPAMSRDYWMPDQSCRVCYECDSQFSLFNRRHHCRICGRVFCGKCTQNTLPVPLDGRGNLYEGESVRVCNFCFKLRKHDSARFNCAQSSTLVLTPSSSSLSLASSSTNCSSIVSSSAYPGSNFIDSAVKGSLADGVDSYSEKKPPPMMILPRRKTNKSLSPRQRDTSPNPYDFCSNRSDDEDDCQKEARCLDFRSYKMQGPHLDEEGDDSCAEMDLLDIVQKCPPDCLEHCIIKTANNENEGENNYEKCVEYQNITAVEGTLSRMSGLSEGYEVPDDAVEESNFYKPLYEEKCIYQGSGHVEDELIDVQNNKLLWDPPSPGDKEDEMGIVMVDDDDEDDEGDWKLPCPASSLSVNEYKSRETAASGEQRKAMQAVVDRHFRVLVAQLLNDEGIPVEEDQKESWLEVVTDISLKAANLVKPDTSRNGGMDPGGYVKVKCIATGQRCESCVVKGVVCKKNVAHRRMTSRYRNPRVLLLGGALEYQRISNQLSSLDTLLQQERDHLSMTVARIEANRPNVLLVEKTVSRHAQDWLLAKEISLILNVKRPLLERIARCTGAQIVPTSDDLIAPKSGHCEYFHVEKYVEEHGSAGQAGKKLTKTLMFFEGCPKPLGCTVLLKGANGDELKKVKHVVQLAVFAAYHLALETSFLADEGATLPDLTSKSPLSVALPGTQTKSDKSISMIPGFLVPVSLQMHTGDAQAQQIQAVPITKLASSPYASYNVLGLGYTSLKESGEVATIPSSFTSSYVSSMANSLGSIHQITGFDEAFGTGASDAISGGGSLNLHGMTEIPLGRTPAGLDYTSGHQENSLTGLSVSLKKDGFETLSTSTIYMPTSVELLVTDRLSSLAAIPTFESHLNSLSLISNSFQPLEDCQGLGVLKGLEQFNSEINSFQELSLMAQVENHDGLQSEGQESNQEDFPPSPSDHQSILVSLSSNCLSKGIVCERGCLLRIKYYGSFDKPLSRFLCDDLFDMKKRCKFCYEPTDAHAYCYTHRQASLTISIQHQNQILTGGREGKIWMWHRCLKCSRINGLPPATPRVVMSDAARGLSFGKFLELSFSNHAAASRVATCGHSLHRDCLRFYGFGSMIACFRYAPINVHSVYLPPPKLEFHNPGQQEWLRNEISEVTQQGDVIFAETFDTLRQIGEMLVSYGNMKVPGARRHITELECLLQKEKADFEDALQKAAPMKVLPGQPIADILELNCLRRALTICSAMWDKRLHFLRSTLKFRKLPIGSDSLLFKDPSISVPMDPGLGGDSHAPDDSQGTFFNTDIDCSNLVQTPSTVVSVDGSGMPFNEILHRSLEDHSVRSLFIIKSTPNSVELLDDDSFANLLLSRGGADDRSMKSVLEGISSVKEASLSLEEKVVKCHRQIMENSLSNLDSSEGNVNVSSNILEDAARGERSLSEQQFPILANLSDTFEALWTGKGQSVEAHTVHISSNGQELLPCADSPDSTVEFATDNNATNKDFYGEGLMEHHLLNSSSGSLTSSQVGGIGSDLPLACQASLVKTTEVADDLGGWAGTPFSRFYRSYSKGSQSSLTGSPPRTGLPQLSSSSLILSYAGQMATQCCLKVLLPLGINNTVIAIKEDEPTSIIAYAIVSHEYQAHLSDRPVDKDKQKDNGGAREKKFRENEREEREGGDSLKTEVFVPHLLQPVDVPVEQAEVTLKDRPNNSDEELLSSSKESVTSEPLHHSKAMHVKVSFTDESSQWKIRYMVTCYYAKLFDGLRKKCCPSEMDFVRSLCHCKKWGAQGGKSNVFFAKSLDDRFVVKQVTKTELEFFIKFAPEYFNYLSDALSSGSPTCLAKILGIFQVTTRHIKGGKEIQMDLMVMENLLYGRHVTRIYDLKGSVRSRYNADATGTNKVLLDQNLLESMPTNPIFIGNKAKRLLERAVWNDTSFLASADVMDYSLLVGVDEEQQELVLGIIDFMRQYTWDKHLETWVKASGILGGPKNSAPTVISPKQYKTRFRKAMNTYFLMVPDQWSPLTVISGPPLADATGDIYPAGTQDEAVENITSLKLKYIEES